MPATAASQPYGLRAPPSATSKTQAPTTTRISTSPESAVAWTSIIAQRSSRPGPPKPRSVSLHRPNKKTAQKRTINTNKTATWPGLTPTAKATKIRAPRNRQNPGIHQRLRNRLGIGMEHVLHGPLEEARQRDGQRQRRRVALLLDGVDGLARDVHRLRELLLGELARRAEGTNVVAHDVKLACHPFDVKRAFHSNPPGGPKATPPPGPDSGPMTALFPQPLPNRRFRRLLPAALAA